MVRKGLRPSRLLSELDPNLVAVLAALLTGAQHKVNQREEN